MNVTSVRVTFVEPDIAPAGAGLRRLGAFEMAVVPRVGEVVSLQTELGGLNLSYRVRDVVYRMPDVGQVCEEAPVVTEATLIMARDLSDFAYERCMAMAVAAGVRLAMGQALTGDGGPSPRDGPMLPPNGVAGVVGPADDPHRPA